MTTLLQDLRFAIRMLLKSPGFTAIAICTLALGISANSALFSVIKGVLLNPLPYPDSDRVVAVYASTAGIDHAPITYLNFLDWQRETQTFASMAVYRNQDYNFIGPTQAERLSGYTISADFFAVLEIKPMIGRMFNSADDQLGAAPVVVLGGGFWRREFGSDPEVLGKALTLNGKSYTVVGVAPPDLTFYGQDRDVYTPIGQWDDPSFRDRRISVSGRAIGRLRPDVTLAKAGAEMDQIARDLAEAFPVADKNSGITLVSMKQDIVGDVRPFLLVLLAAVGFLLLITCANVANLLLARGIGRSREFAVRAALGAGRMRVLRQLLTESLLLSGLGAGLGLLLTFVADKTLLKMLPATLPRASEIVLDSRVLLFTLAMSIFAAVIFGLAPAVKSSRADLQEMLRQSERGSSGGHTRLQGILVTGEIALAVVLLIGAGLMLRSLSSLWRINPGYVPSHAVTFNLSMPASPTTTSAETRARLRQFDDKMLSLGGVKAVSVTLGSRPMLHDTSLPFWIFGRPKPASDNEMPQAMVYLAEAGFQQAMGLTLQRGRFVTPQDNENSRIVADIDDFFARLYFPNEDPIGKHLHLEQFNVDAEIIGVVGHVRQWGLGNDTKTAIEAQIFYPFMQLPEKLMPLAAASVAVVMRTEDDPSRVVESVRRAVNEIDRRDVIYGAQTLDDVLASSVAAPQLSMVLLAIFAAMALILSCVGIYGVISHLISQRTREIGVRMALGAQSNDVLRLVLGHGAKMALLGVVVGIAAAFGLTRLMANQLFGVSPSDPLTFGSVAVLLALVALLACYLPARRAIRVNPIIALRHE